MTWRFIKWIWHIQGSIALAPGQSAAEAFDRLDPLFRQRGTSYERAADTLTFRKKNQAPQDKMSIIDGGLLTVKRDSAGTALHYRMTSRALLFCFLAPLLFLGFAGLTLGIGILEKPSAEEVASEKKEREAEEKKKPKKELHAIDKFLGAPSPEMIKEERDDYSPIPALVFAAIFAALYAIGRVLEPWLIKSAFRKRLSGNHPPDHETALPQP